jgi:hypothetical protein
LEYPKCPQTERIEKFISREHTRKRTILMIRVKTMKAKNLIVIIVLSSVKLVMTSQPSRTLDDKHKKHLESAHRLPDQKNVLIKHGHTKNFYLKPMNRNSDFDYDGESYGSLPAMDNYIRYIDLHNQTVTFYLSIL